MAKVYDNLFKEVLAEVIRHLLHVTHNITITTLQQVPGNFPSVELREVDFLAKVTFTDGSQEMLHVEVQSTNDASMPLRMVEYFAKIYKAHRLPVNQLVLYIGREKLYMKNEINVRGHFSRTEHQYLLVDIAHMPPERFLAAPQPEINVLAVLAHLPDDTAASETIRIILQRLASTLPDRQLHDFLEKLDILCRLRKLEPLLKTEVKKMGLKFDPRGTLLYDMGMEEGKKEGIKEGIKKGKKEGKKEGIKEGLRRAILVGLKARFGAEAVENAHVSDLLTQIDSEAILERLGERVYTISSLAEFLTYLKAQI